MNKLKQIIKKIVGLKLLSYYRYIRNLKNKKDNNKSLLYLLKN